MKNIALISLIILGIFNIPIDGLSQCVKNEANVYTFKYKGNKYEVVKETLNWVDAAACAVTRGGMLAEINSQEEQDSIFHYINQAGITSGNTSAPDGGGAAYLWIGGNDKATEGAWIWDGNNDKMSTQFWQGTTSGSAVGGLYNNWGNEPDDFSGQDALGIAFTDWPRGSAGEWNDIDETNTLYYVVEFATTSGVHASNSIATFDLSPNPSTGKLWIRIPGAAYEHNQTTIYIYSSLGNLILIHPAGGLSNNVDLTDLINGTYFVMVKNTSTSFAPRKLLINR